MKSRIRWAITAVVLILLIVYARTLRWDVIVATLRGASFSLVIAAILVNLLTLGVRGILWWMFLRRLGPVSLTTAIRGEVVGAALNSVVIANGGEAVRVLLVARETGLPSSKVLASLTAERLFDPLTFLLLFTVGVIVFDLPPALETFRWAAAGLLILVLCLGIFLIRFKPRAVGAVSEPASRAWSGRALAKLRAFGHDVGRLANASRFAMALVLSATIWSMQLGVYSLGGLAAGVDLPLSGVVASLLLANAALVLRATPGNVGVFQVTYVIAAAEFGISTETATAAALLIQSIQIIPVLLLGIALTPRLMLLRARAASSDDSVSGSESTG